MSEKVKTVLNKFFTPRNYIHLWPDLPILSGWLKQTKEAKWHYKKKKKSFKRAGTIPRFGNKRLKVIAWPQKKKKKKKNSSSSTSSSRRRWYAVNEETSGWPRRHSKGRPRRNNHGRRIRHSSDRRERIQWVNEVRCVFFFLIILDSWKYNIILLLSIFPILRRGKKVSSCEIFHIFVISYFVLELVFANEHTF